MSRLDKLKNQSLVGLRLMNAGTEVASLHQVWEAQVADHVIALRWQPNGQSLAAAAVSGPVSVFASETGAERRTFSGHGFGTTNLDWHPHMARLATAGQDGKVKVWDVETGALVFELAGGAAWVEHVAWSSSGKYLASAASRKLRLWSAEGEVVQAYADYDSTIAGLAWQPGVERLANVGYGGVALWSPTEPQPLRRYQWKGSSLALAWSPDTKYIATGDQDSTVHFWYVKTGKDLQMWGYPTKVRELSWDRNSRYLATGGGEQVVMWDCSGKGPEGTKPLMLNWHEGFLSGLAFQKRGAHLASVGQDGRVAVWNLTQPKQPLAKTRFTMPISQLAWAPDDAHLAIGGEDGRVIVLRLE